jgi:hypothetical protein
MEILDWLSEDTNYGIKIDLALQSAQDSNQYLQQESRVLCVWSYVNFHDLYKHKIDGEEYLAV